MNVGRVSWKWNPDLTPEVMPGWMPSLNSIRKTGRPHSCAGRVPRRGGLSSGGTPGVHQPGPQGFSKLGLRRGDLLFLFLHGAQGQAHHQGVYGHSLLRERDREVLNRLQSAFKLEVGKMSEDRRFSLEVVRCLGACGLAPVVVVDTDTHGGITRIA